MNSKYVSPIYDKYREWIAKARNQGGWSWEKIYFGGGTTETDLIAFIHSQQLNWWDINVEDWKALVGLEKYSEERRIKMSNAERNAIIGDGEEVNWIEIPSSETSSWIKYKRHLLEDKHFLYDDVLDIENSSFRILKRLNSDTKGEAVKGLVVGNVQSGKTANMAALMAMAADYGWNMFIVLSGTIDNLRKQTLDRLLEDLKLPGCNLTWSGIPHPMKNGITEHKPQNLSFEPGSLNRYLTVCLKNSKRLKDLIEWLHEDRNSANQMKILLIDDEADQAGINTKDIDEDEKTKINELIINLVSNKYSDGAERDDCFAAMNYIGYTATPYANVLNDASLESLYPKNFISTLQVSKNYFGPQQIFGDRSANTYKGLNIVRNIDTCEVDLIRNIHKETEAEVPKELEKAICWFLCCVAAMRKQAFKKPLSMLIHTSQLVKHHNAMNALLRTWFENEINYIVNKCRDVWSFETNEFKKEDLFNGYPEFATPMEEIRDYPKFDDIRNYLIELLENGVQNIMLGEDGDLEYNKGIHLCVDNARNNGVKADGAYVRLAYPSKEISLDFAPAFIVIGGATLSRGLTIEGLVSTYFLRASKQGDTLMQMGRWFGYRKGYELLPRIWLTDTSYNQFEFLADLDSEMRSYISQMELFDRSPSDYAVVIKQAPAKLFKVTNKNRMQGAIPTEMNYSGMHSQTHLFVDDDRLLRENYTTIKNFVESLGVGEKGKGDLGKSCYVWKNIEFNYIYNTLLTRYNFHPNNMAFLNLRELKVWINKVTDEEKLSNWNVVLFGLGQGKKKVEFSNCEINAVKRTRKMLRDGTINIGVLTDPKERVADVDYNQLSLKGKEKYDNYHTDHADFIRKDAGLETVPSIVLYIIDKDSKKREDSKRFDMNATCDVAGISINVPGDRINEKYAASIMIDLKKFGLGNDIEGEDDEN